MQKEDKFIGLERHITKAIAVIVGHMTDGNTPANVQLRASQIYLDLSMKYSRMAELEEQVRILEAQLLAQDNIGIERAETNENTYPLEDDEEEEEDE